jgi:hypothetical protein
MSSGVARTARVHHSSTAQSHEFKAYIPELLRKLAVPDVGHGYLLLFFEAGADSLVLENQRIIFNGLQSDPLARIQQPGDSLPFTLVCHIFLRCFEIGIAVPPDIFQAFIAGSHSCLSDDLIVLVKGRDSAVSSGGLLLMIGLIWSNKSRAILELRH